MTIPCNRYQQAIDLLASRLDLLHTLARDLNSAAEAVGDLDVLSIHAFCARLDRTVSVIESVDRELDKLTGGRVRRNARGTKASFPEPGASDRMQELLDQTEVAIDEVSRLNRVFGELITASNRNLRLMENICRAGAPAYPTGALPGNSSSELQTRG